MREGEDQKAAEIPTRERRIKTAAIAWGSTALFAIVTLLPVIRRLRHPTILGDDITRIVDLVKYPFGEHLFLPFAEHIAPFFQLVSWITWEAIGHDVRLAPLGYSAASVLSWVVVLALLGVWLVRETGSRTASLIAVALAAQSPLVLETAWWYSASSFLWAIAGVLLAILGASFLSRRPITALVMIAAGSALGLAGTTLGILAVPLAIVRGLLEPRASRWRKALVIVAAGAGAVAYRQFCKLGGLHSDPRSGLPGVDLVGGLSYALSVPGRILWPSLAGVPVSSTIVPLPPWLCFGAGAIALAVTLALALWPRASWNRRIVLLGAAMIYSSYTLTYAARVSMLKQGRWTEPQFLYQTAARYHVLPLLGALAILATLLASWPLLRRCDARHGLPALLGAIVGLATMFMQSREVSQWDWMLNQPDQHTTLAAVSHAGELALAIGVPRTQLLRVFDPVHRDWNGSVMNDRPYAFHLMNLAVQAPEMVERPLADDVARARLVAGLTPGERVALGSGTCAFLAPTIADLADSTVSVARRVEARHIREFEPGKFRVNSWPAFLEFEFERTPHARYLVLPGLSADQDMIVLLSDTEGRWRQGQNVRWLKSPRADAVIDLERLIHWSGQSLTGIRIVFTCPGELALDGPPRLMR